MKLEIGIHHIAEAIGLLGAIVFYSRLRNSYMRWFLPFLASVLILELLTNFLYFNLAIPTSGPMAVSNLLSVSFYAFIFARIIINGKHRQFIQLATIIYVAVILLLWMFVGVSSILVDSIVIGGFLMIISASLVFYQYLQTDDPKLMYQMVSHLWIAAGILLFYSGIEIVIAAIPYARQHKIMLWGYPVYNTIPRLLSAILYPCFVIAFYTWKKR